MYDFERKNSSRVFYFCTNNNRKDFSYIIFPSIFPIATLDVVRKPSFIRDASNSVHFPPLPFYLSFSDTWISICLGAHFQDFPFPASEFLIPPSNNDRIFSSQRYLDALQTRTVRVTIPNIPFTSRETVMQLRKNHKRTI